MKKLGLLAVMVVLAGCGSPPVDPNVAACPERTILVLQHNQRFIEGIKLGETSAKDVGELDGLKRKATLEKGGESMDIAFYQTGMPGCPWMVWGESLTPIVMKGGVVTAVGTQSVKDLTAHGWKLKEADWPWQRYDFGYIPIK